MIQKLSATLLLLFTITIAKAQQSEVTNTYIKNYRAIAIEEMQRTGVPAAIKLAQGVLETMSGQSPLVLKSNNHFGIKCKAGYDGPYVLHDDDAPNERFMKYENSDQSYKDHSDFLKSRSRYASLFQLDPMDYKSWAYGLKAAGYATNPKYPQLIINIIEKYNLQDYTLIALGKMEMPVDLKEYMAAKKGIKEEPVLAASKYPDNDFKINDTRVVFAPKGTSYAALAQQYNIPLGRLYDFNDIKNMADKTQKGELVFLQLKRTVGNAEFYEVQEGESIYDIAQATGIRLESLLKYNNLTKFSSPAIGSKLYLQDTGNKLVTN